jgi:Protein of unknown function (DUF3352)
LRRRLFQTGVAVACAAGLALGGCGDDGDSGDLASLVPPDVPLYAEAVLRPEGEQREAVESLSEQVAGIDDPGARLIEELDRALAEEAGEFTYEDDIEPWLGERGGVFVLSFANGGGEPDLAAIVEVTDTEAAQDFIDESAEANPEEVGEDRSYEGFDYLTSPDGDAVAGLVGDALVVGTESSFKVAVDASEGESLAESDAYTERLEPLEDDGLATLYVDPGAAIDAAIEAGDVDPQGARAVEPLLGGALSDPITLGLTATEDAATFDLVATVDGAHPAAGDGTLLEGMPAGAWLAIGATDLGPAIERWLDQLANSGIPGAEAIERRIRAGTGIELRRDVTPWLGDAAAFIRGIEPPGMAFGLVAETSDPQGPRKLVETVQRLAETDSGLRSAAPPQGADYGFSLGIPGVGAGAEVGVVGDRLAAALGTSLEQVLEPDETLAGDDGFQAAAELLGEEFPPSVFLDIQQGVAIAELGADADSPDYDAARPYVEKLGSLVGGARVEDGLLVSRLIVTLAQ